MERDKSKINRGEVIHKLNTEQLVQKWIKCPSCCYTFIECSRVGEVWQRERGSIDNWNMGRQNLAGCVPCWPTHKGFPRDKHRAPHCHHWHHSHRRLSPGSAGREHQSHSFSSKQKIRILIQPEENVSTSNVVYNIVQETKFLKKRMKL